MASPSSLRCVLVTLVLAVTGCIDGIGNSLGGQDACPGDAELPDEGEGKPFHVRIGNRAQEAECVLVRVDDALAVSSEIPSSHQDPEPVRPGNHGEFQWSGDSMIVDVSVPGKGFEERVVVDTMHDENWIVVWVYEDHVEAYHTDDYREPME